MDIAGPYPRTPQGYKYVLVLYDHFSKVTGLLPLKNKTSTAIITALRNSVFGLMPSPRRFVIDADRGFDNHEFRQFAKQKRIEIQTVPVRAHQANNAEIRIKKLVELIRIYIHDHSLIEKDQGFWYDGLNDFVIALNSVPHDTIGKVPWNVLFGKDFSSALDYALHPKSTFSDKSATSSFLQRRGHIFDLVRNNMMKSHDVIGEQYQKRVQPINIKIGDKVKYKASYISSKIDNFNAKLAPLYTAVYTVIEFKSENVAIIQSDENPSAKPREAHITHLQHWYTQKTVSIPSLDSVQTINNSENKSSMSLPVLSNNNANSIPALEGVEDMYIVPSLNSSRDRYRRMLRRRPSIKYTK
jgi:hypothetical protein